MTTKILLLDVDGVLLNTSKWMASYFGKSVEDITRWDFGECLGVTAEQVHTAFADMVTRRKYIPEYEGAAEFVAWAKEHYEVCAVTSPSYDVPGWVDMRHVQLLGLGIDPNHQVHTKAKHLVRGDVFVDDHPGNLDAWMRAHPGGLPILRRHPYNEEAGQRHYSVPSLHALRTLIAERVRT